MLKISPMAHFAVDFLLLSLLVPVLAWPLSAPLLVVPAVLSALVARLRTVADRQTMTVRTLLGSLSVRWDEIAGLRFGRGSWAHAHLDGGGQLRLPAVAFATLPLLARPAAGGCPTRTAEALKPAGSRRSAAPTSRRRPRCRAAAPQSIR